MDEWLLGGGKNITDEKCGIKRRVWREVKLMWETALIPSVLTRVSAFGILLATQSFLGHISEFDISAFGLVQTTLIRFIHGTLIGITSSETDHTAKGDSSFQRSKKCDILTAAMTVPFFVFAAALLLGEQENSDGLVARLYLSCIPFLHYMVFNLTIQMLLQPPRFSDRGNAILVWLSVISFALHHLLSWLFVDKLGWGTVGSLVTTNIALWASGIGQFLYFYGNWFAIDKSDDSSSLAALDVWAIVKFSVSSGIMLCSDLWYNSNILLLLAVYMNDVTAASISAFSICLNICSWEFMICLGFLSCACIRVSNEMARGNTKAAKFCIRVILSISVLVGVLLCILCLVFRRKISYFFSAEDLHVADAVSDLSTLLAFSILLKTINPVLSGVAIGAGLQGTVAIVNICCYYGIGIPLGALLACVAHLQVKGLWIGILCGELAQLLILIIFLIRKIDWQD